MDLSLFIIHSFLRPRFRLSWADRTRSTFFRVGGPFNNNWITSTEFIKKESFRWTITVSGWWHKLYCDVNAFLFSSPFLRSPYSKWQQRVERKKNNKNVPWKIFIWLKYKFYVLLFGYIFTKARGRWQVRRTEIQKDIFKCHEFLFTEKLLEQAVSVQVVFRVQLYLAEAFTSLRTFAVRLVREGGFRTLRCC